ncbi:MAG: hypothetical protein BWK73_20915 [Thiothrix lacustris]|uniref:Uncharacterized protein n=1 Tax=Thiothrix lacustris TaxID=525917 RepID=A0A1Y1QNS0_9GAMM|nr:MAG: hypothetical protein BWK73_20915 [Thiothrix lacustris]
MKTKTWQEKMKNMVRTIEPAKSGDSDLGPFKWLPSGVWKNNGEQFGFNVIALPFKDANLGYRVLTNKYRETLEFTTVDKAVPNRGVEPAVGNDFSDIEIEKCHERDSAVQGNFKTVDQFILTLDYIQEITQVEAVSFPDIPPEDGLQETAKCSKKIHHEPGLFLRMSNPVDSTIQRKPTVQNIPLNLARLATIPHGDSVLALGSCEALEYSGSAFEDILNQSSGALADKKMREYLGIPLDDFEIGKPQGTTQDINSGYLKPYRETKIDRDTDNEFDPVIPQARLFNDLKKALGVPDFKITSGNFPIKRTTKIFFDTDFGTGGILNIPFVTRQANAAAMRATFWIHELESSTDGNEPEIILQYLQSVLLDFHVIRSDDLPGRIRWPHISINTMKKFKDRSVDPFIGTEACATSVAQA